MNGVRLDDSAFCLLHGSNDVNTALLLGSTVIFFILPMIFIVILYLRIGFKLRRSTLYKGPTGSNPTSFKNVNGTNGGSSKSVSGAPVRKFSLINGTRQQQHHLSSSRKIIKLLGELALFPFHHESWYDSFDFFSARFRTTLLRPRLRRGCFRSRL